jgi:hypothetical protein
MIVPGKFVGHDAWWLRSTKDARADIFRTRKGRTMTTEADENTGEKACSATTVLGRSRRGRDSAAITGFERKGDVAWIRQGGGALKTEIYARHYCGHFFVPEAWQLLRCIISRERDWTSARLSKTFWKQY